VEEPRPLEGEGPEGARRRGLIGGGARTRVSGPGVESPLLASPCPSPESIEEARKLGVLLVISLDPGCSGYREAAGRLGVAVLEYPLQPLAAKPVEELNELARVALGVVRAGARVMVHGSGESDDRCSFVASALAEALGCAAPPQQAPLSRVQELALAWYSRLLRLLGVELLHGLYEVGRVYDFGSGLEHASTVANVGLDLAQALPGFSESDLRTVYAAGLLHDIGRYFTERGHEEVGVKLLGEHAGFLAREFDYELLAFCVRHHRRHTDPERDPAAGKLGERGLLAAAAVRLADSFTNVYEKEEYWGVRVEGGALKVVARRANKRRFEAKAELLEKISGLKVELTPP